MVPDGIGGVSFTGTFQDEVEFDPNGGGLLGSTNNVVSAYLQSLSN